ncbi:transporter substrate-binding domain-containing protein [Pseudoalteromonas sp. CO348]|nr:transporter substrate-binding domain-containing protein [Pseudoalteromonas sp. CO348]
MLKTRLIRGLMLGLTLFTMHVTGKEVVQLATHDAYPYHYVENELVKGNVIRQVQCAFSRMEAPYRAEFDSWVEAELKLRTGKLDAIFAVAQSDARMRYGTLSIPMARKHLYWYFSGAEMDINDNNPLYKKYKVAAEFGSDEWFDIKRKGYNVQMKPRSGNALLKLLLGHEVDAILIDEHEFEHELAKFKLQNTNFSRREYGTIELGILFSKAFLKKRPTFLEAFNTAASNCIVADDRKL